MTEERVGEFYDRVSNSYDRQRFSRSYYRNVAETEQRFVLGKIRPGACVLEIGPGTGRFTSLMVEKAGHVTAIDISQGMLDQVRGKVAAKNLTMQRLSIFDIEQLAEYGQFDTIVCMRVLPHLEDPQAALKLMSAAVIAGGNLLFDFWNLNSFVGLIRKVFRRRLQVYTRFYSYPETLQMIDRARLRITDSIAWGYPRIGAISMDRLGNKVLKSAGYSHIFNAVRK